MTVRGCMTIFILLLFSTMANGQKITWSEHIAPIIHQNCTPCHRRGEAAPFPLNTYEEVAKRAAFIKRVTQSRYMPPWMPDPHYASFAGERKLTSEQIAEIADWADHNMPKGKEPENKEKNLLIEGTQYSRKPDLVLSMKDEYKVIGDNTDKLVVYKIPFELPDSMNVEAVEFITNNKAVVHHANYEIEDVPDLDIYKTLDYMEDAESKVEYFEQYVPYRKKIVYYGGWVPGSTYQSYPANVGWVMPKRGVILLTLHYAPVGKDQNAFSGIQFFFTKTPVKRQIQMFSFGSGGIGQKQIDPYFYIPPNVVKSFKLKIGTDRDRSLLYICPHMHYLGRSFKSFAVTPTGDTIKLVSIPDWNFNWQEIYSFKKLKKIPAGSILNIEATYDNTENNPFNPASPPILVHEAMRTRDEMMTLMLIMLPYEEGDENIDVKSFGTAH
jgi:hypothetical protein